MQRVLGLRERRVHRLRHRGAADGGIRERHPGDGIRGAPGGRGDAAAFAEAERSLSGRGKPLEFEWDEKTLRAKLPVPAGKGAASRVRIGLAIEAPETSAFFVDARRLVIGQKNPISTSYSSEQLAARSRLRLPENFTAKPVPKSPLEIDYELDVPRDALHGSWVNLGIEADGVLLGRARVQLFRPLSVYLADAIKLHFGAEEELAIEPALVARDPKGARNLDVTLRNNSPQIRSFAVEALVDGWEFMPPKTEISIGGVMERIVSLRAFAKGAESGVSEGRLKISGGTQLEVPLRIVAVPRGQTIAYSMDLDGDGEPEWVLESQSARAVFSTRDGGRWLEFVWKDTGGNFLPEQGALAGTGRRRGQEVGGSAGVRSGHLEAHGQAGWRRAEHRAERAAAAGDAADLQAGRRESQGYTRIPASGRV